MSQDLSPRKSRVNTRGRPFAPGNPGRPAGIRNKAATMLEAMFDGEAEEIGRKAVELAKRGRLDAIRLVLDRACPPRKGRSGGDVTLPAMETAADAVAAMGTIATAVATGALTLPEARDLSEIVETFRRAHETADIARRVAVLEQEVAHGARKAG
jgi:hypothetical protein